LIASTVPVETTSVWPSGGAVATLAAASIRAAPGLFSITTGLPSFPCSLSA
jgi:hypothetical protein